MLGCGPLTLPQNLPFVQKLHGIIGRLLVVGLLKIKTFLALSLLLCRGLNYRYS